METSRSPAIRSQHASKAPNPLRDEEGNDWDKESKAILRVEVREQNEERKASKEKQDAQQNTSQNKLKSEKLRRTGSRMLLASLVTVSKKETSTVSSLKKREWAGYRLGVRQ